MRKERYYSRSFMVCQPSRRSITIFRKAFKGDLWKISHEGFGIVFFAVFYTITPANLKLWFYVLCESFVFFVPFDVWKETNPAMIFRWILCNNKKVNSEFHFDFHCEQEIVMFRRNFFKGMFPIFRHNKNEVNVCRFFDARHNKTTVHNQGDADLIRL